MCRVPPVRDLTVRGNVPWGSPWYLRISAWFAPSKLHWPWPNTRPGISVRGGPGLFGLDDQAALVVVNHFGVTYSLDDLVTGLWVVQQAVVARDAHVGSGVEV